MISDVGRQIDSRWLVLEESTAEAACRGRETVGVLKIACICFRAQHAALKMAADLKAAASAADPYENSCWWIFYCLLLMRVL